MEQKKQASKHLSWLLYLGIASISLNVLTDILVNDGWAFWLESFLTVGTVCCLYLLTPADRGYRLSSILRTAMLLLHIATYTIGTLLLRTYIETPELLHLFNAITTVLNLAIIPLSIAGTWLEYRAHGALVSGTDAAFQRKWNILFFLQLGTALFYSLGTYVAAYLQQLLQWDIATTHGLVLAILNLPVKAAYLLYLLYLYRTIRLVRESKE